MSRRLGRSIKLPTRNDGGRGCIKKRTMIKPPNGEKKLPIVKHRQKGGEHYQLAAVRGVESGRVKKRGRPSQEIWGKEKSGDKFSWKGNPRDRLTKSFPKERLNLQEKKGRKVEERQRKNFEKTDTFTGGVIQPGGLPRRRKHGGFKWKSLGESCAPAKRKRDAATAADGGNVLAIGKRLERDRGRIHLKKKDCLGRKGREKGENRSLKRADRRFLMFQCEKVTRR